MFFYLYAVIELLAIFLDSGIIPTASAVYPVCGLLPSSSHASIDTLSFSGSRRSTLA